MLVKMVDNTRMIIGIISHRTHVVPCFCLKIYVDIDSCQMGNVKESEENLSRGK
jgi:hypothetical protein